MHLRLLANPLALAATLLLAACSPSTQAPSASAKPVVVATIFSYYDAARSIAGPDADAKILLPPGNSPHDFNPSASDKNTVNTANLLIKNGLGIDDWLDPLSADNKSATRLSMGDYIQAINTREEALPGAAPHEEHASTLNPHVWLDPTNQIIAAEKICDALIALDPAHKSGYEQRAEKYIADLKQLDADFKAAAATFKHKSFIGFHSAYDYLAKRYGLTEAAALEEIGTGGISPAQLQLIIKKINDEHIPVVFTETAFDASQAEVVTKQTGVKLGTLQPLETYDNVTDTYISLMRQNLEELKKAMQ